MDKQIDVDYKHKDGVEGMEHNFVHSELWFCKECR